jgi:hypothetical protein
MVESAVLIATFARPEYARQTFDAIKKAQPKKLYFYSNKAREDKPEEIARNNEIRAYVDEIDWECELKTYFRDEYVDVFTSLWGAYDWFFENEESGIVLEEDCVPSLAFFDFCDQLLPKYKDDQRVWLISGNNFIEGYAPIKYDYTFHYFSYMYGWASWRDRWKQTIRTDLPIDEIKEFRLLEQLHVNKKAAKKEFNTILRNRETNSWDYRFQTTMRCLNGLGVIPKQNLVNNIGVVGANNNGSSFSHNKMTVKDESFYINNPPPFVIADISYAEQWYKRVYLKKSNLVVRVVKKIIRILVKESNRNV